MSSPPPLLPFSGEWEAYLDSVYEHFCEDLVYTKLLFRGKLIRARYTPATNGKGFSFWHVISEGEREEDRLPDFRRCERIRWIAWMVIQADAANPKILSWKNTRTLQRGTRERQVLFCEEIQYVVILEEHTDYFHLVSAYPVNERRVAKLKTEWEKCQK